MPVPRAFVIFETVQNKRQPVKKKFIVVILGSNIYYSMQ